MPTRGEQISERPDPAGEENLPTGIASVAGRYALAGALFGLFFPLIAMLILLLYRALPFQWSSLIEVQRTEPALWIVDLAPLVLAMVASIAGQREDRLRRALARLQREQETSLLFRQLTEQLERRTIQLNTSVEVSRHLSTILKLEDLLAEVVTLIKARFGYYHAHIYLLDESGENLVVAEGTGPAGAEMKARGHSIPVAATTSLVARAARTAQVVRVDNVREADDWLPNPLLPDTYSEMAVPISLGEDRQVVGVLDVQQDRVAGLDESDASLLCSLANQVAVAIRNARLFADVEAALEEARQLQARYLEQAWDRNKITRHGARQGRAVYSRSEPAALNEAAMNQARQQAQNLEEPAVLASAGDQPAAGRAMLVAPVKLHQTTIGNLQLHGLDPDRQWTDDELALIEAVLGQVAQAAENLRLFEETRERASREQLLGQISDKLRRAPDLETLMQVTVSEVARVLGPARTFVRLDDPAELPGAAGAPAGGNGQFERGANAAEG